jgi:nitrite reductase (NADH) small subunit
MTSILERTALERTVPDDWVPVCRYDQLLPERGAAALLGDRSVAVFRTWEGEVLAVDNRDPFSGASVLSRGIVGTRAGVPTVASPMYKQVFDLRTGRCLDDPAVSVPVLPARVRRGFVELAVRSRP